MQQSRNILYIDDDAGLRRLVSKLLGRRGHVVDTAEGGAEGIAKARDGNFDLIAVDHYMPGMDGLATLSALRSMPDCPPVIYVTGSEESKVAVAAIKAGAAEYVVKSAGDDFVDLLERAFGQALASVRLAQEKAAAEDALRAANERLETLLKEVNHRVANSLQLVSTFIHMQSRGLDNDAAREALGDTQRRIDAIAQVHRKLYTSDDVESIEMSDYLAAIVEELEGTWSTPDAPRSIRLVATPLRLHPDKAVSVGVIVNELVSNACKYAYHPDSSGEIRVELSRAGESRFSLMVEDDGIGMLAGDAPRGSGLGSKLVLAMAKSLAADFDYDPAHTGVRARLVAAF
ncbi:MAG: response regulator [Pseudomonadota bacterium]